MSFLRNMDWIYKLIPDLGNQLAPYTVDTDEIDEELMSIFMDEMQRLKSQLQTAVAQKDMQEVRVAAHSIKGMGGTVGLPELSVFGEKLGFLAREDQTSEVEAFVEEFLKALNGVD